MVPEQVACVFHMRGAAWLYAQLLSMPGYHAGLQELRLTSCTHLSHGCLVHLRNASRLTRLDLSQCKWVDNRDMAVLRGYRQLQDLSLACCTAVTNSGKHQVPLLVLHTSASQVHKWLLFAAVCNGAWKAYGCALQVLYCCHRTLV